MSGSGAAAAATARVLRGADRAGRSNSAAPLSSAGSNNRIVPYTPSYPASRRTSPRRSRAMASATMDGARAARSSSGTAPRMESSGPNRSTMALTCVVTDFDLAPTPAISPSISGSGTNDANPAAPGTR